MTHDTFSLEERLRELAKIPEQNPDPVVRISKDGTLLFANSHSKPLLELWECEINQPVPEALRQRVSDALNANAKGDVDVQCGDLVFSLIFAPVVESDYVNIYGRDVTHLKRTMAELEEARERLFTILNTAPDAIFGVDINGDIRFINSAAEAMVGYEAKEVLRKKFTMLMPEKSRAAYEKRLDEGLQTGRSSFTGELTEGEGLHKDGSIFPVESTNREIRLYDWKLNLSIVRDISNRKRVEEELRTAKEEADKANQAKSDFLSSMSHELRTPLNAILGFAQMLDYNPKEPLTEKQKTSVGQILKGGQHLLELINDVLDLAKVEAGKVDLSMENLLANAALNECTTLVQDMAESRGIRIVIGEGFLTALKIRADYTRFKQVLLNLMSNGVKYNSENGELKIDCHETPAAMLHITVTDTGEGIPKDKQEEVFQPFSRLGAENTEIEGTGIGLSITKQLVERMGGEIGFNSEIGKGATFWVEFPLAEHGFTEEGKSKTGTVVENVKRLPDVNANILYVEDNPDNLKLMENIVEHIANLTMISAPNAEMGIELAKSKNPDLIIHDINLAGADGYEALKELRASERTRHIPVIALSANAMPQDIKKGIDAGFNYYLTKPIKVEEIARTIKMALEG